MDRAMSLEALAEEAEEEEWENSDSETDTDDEGIRRGEPNKFDSLCDGTLNAQALVHASLTELLELKDELLKHTLPPNVLMKIALVFTKVFRSISDMDMPLDELIRMVRVYSTPWEEKSAALKKLHEDYESKKRQLNIAIKRLQLVDAHSKRMAREKRIMNWEKLYAKLTSARGHGRRWKFLIESFKDKAKLGMDHLQKYLDTMEEPLSDDEEVRRPRSPGEIQTQVEEHAEEPESDVAQEASAESPQPTSEGQGDEDDEGSESEDDSVGKPPRPASEMETESNLSSEKQEEVPTYIRPPMKDKYCWTHEPQYDHFLHVRVYKPEEVEYNELRCSLSLGQQKHKTAILDTPSTAPAPEEKAPESKAAVAPSQPEPKPDSKMASRRPQRGLFGSRGIGAATNGRPGAARAAAPPPLKEEPSPPPGDTKSMFEEVVFAVPDRDAKQKTEQQNEDHKYLKVAVHFGPREEMLSMATIEMADLEGLDLPVFHQPKPRGDYFRVLHSSPYDGDEESEGEEEEEERLLKEKQEVLEELDPISFPLYSIHAGKSDAVHMPSGAIPLLCYWSKRLIPRTMHRMTESESVNQIVLDMTGFDLQEVTKEDLHPLTLHKAVSPMVFTPEPQEDMVPRWELDKVMDVHRQEMEMVQDEYEKRLQELVESMENLQNAQKQRKTPSPARSASPPRPRTYSAPGSHGDAPSMEASPQPLPPQQCSFHRPRQKTTRHMKNFMIGRPLPNWGEHLPKNFFDRLRLFEEESNKHKQELNEKSEQEIREAIEKRLAVEYKLNKGQDYDALEDVSLPAVFMPSKGSNIYNPRAHHYFHPSGSKDLRLTQPPSMLHLPPLNKTKVSVLNLFDMSQNFHRGGPEWLMQRYIAQQESVDKMGQEASTPGELISPGPTVVRPDTMMLQRETSSLLPPATPASRPVAECE